MGRSRRQRWSWSGWTRAGWIRSGWIKVAVGLVGVLGVVLSGGGGLRFPSSHGRVPGDLVPLFRTAATQYGVLTPAQLAGQARVESKFNVHAQSPAGARGLMQFLPETWRRFGVDGDRDGVANPLDPADAIPSAARYDAHLGLLLRAVPGDPVSLVLAAYNAGPEAVRRAHGVPSYGETRAYVDRVRGWAERFRNQV